MEQQIDPALIMQNHFRKGTSVMGSSWRGEEEKEEDEREAEASRCASRRDRKSHQQLAPCGRSCFHLLASSHLTKEQRLSLFVIVSATALELIVDTT